VINQPHSRESILKARTRMEDLLHAITGEVAERSRGRCPYRAVGDACTFEYGCHNQVRRDGHRFCGGAPLNGSHATRLTARDRMALAMRHQAPDRVPFMCQLALGHYFLHSGLDAIDIWHDTAAFGDALIALQRRYGFDGILVNLPGRDPDWRRHIARVESGVGERRVVWRGGLVTVMPRDDNPHVYHADGSPLHHPSFAELDPEQLYYVEPHDHSGVSYPYRWGFDAEPAARDAFFPPWHWDTIRYVRELAPDVSVHGEVFSPFTQFMELLDYTNALLAIMDDAGKAKACLDALTAGTIELMIGHARAGADAVLISSAFAGAGLISPAHYEEFVQPFERRAITGFKSAYPDVPVYTHTCGAIGDRLELLAGTGTDGIDTLDPPPLGDVDLADAKQRIGARLFIKGNVDPVNTLLAGTPRECYDDACRRLEIGKPGAGYILSSACSVSPATPPENIHALRAAVEQSGRY